ncbi:hypothetical protein HWV62_11948 [Athelia sp. TMB]|nr:hypothetical protein HWV62_11948 [Athelia sp. TMB]
MADKECPNPTKDQWMNVMNHDGLTEEEIARRKAYYTKLREKIVNWYLTHYTPVKDTKDQKTEVQKMISEMVGTLPKRPRKMQLIQYYSHKYYHDPRKGIKAFVDRTWQAEEKKPVPPGTKKMRQLDYGNKITAEYFARETEEFKRQLKKERDAVLERKMKEYNEKLASIDKVPETVEGYHESLANSVAFLQPVADLAARRFGAAVSILMVLPIGENKGDIEMCSVHSGETKALNPQAWPDYDVLGFQAVQESFVSFGRQVFTKGDRSKRLLPAKPQEEESPAAGPSNLLSIPNPSFDLPEHPTTTPTFNLDDDLASFFDSPLPDTFTTALRCDNKHEDPPTRLEDFAPHLPTPSATPSTSNTPLLGSTTETSNSHNILVPSILPEGLRPLHHGQDQQSGSRDELQTLHIPFHSLSSYSPPHQ